MAVKIAGLRLTNRKPWCECAVAREGILDGSVMIYIVLIRKYYNATDMRLARSATSAMR